MLIGGGARARHAAWRAPRTWRGPRPVPLARGLGLGHGQRCSPRFFKLRCKDRALQPPAPHPYDGVEHLGQPAAPTPTGDYKMVRLIAPLTPCRGCHRNTRLKRLGAGASSPSGPAGVRLEGQRWLSHAGKVGTRIHGIHGKRAAGNPPGLKSPDPTLGDTGHTGRVSG